ncbi:MAG: phage tail terminator protein [Gammaproteobacteria bacterium]
MLTLQTDIIVRIQSQVPGFKTVANPSVLAGLRDIGPLLPACLVVPGAGEPIEQRQPQLPTVEQQEWEIVVIVAHQHIEADNGRTEKIAGGFMHEILKALHGWKAGAVPQKNGFIYTGRDKPAYSVGYAEFPMTFISKAIIGAT